ncbi:hypothetical protein MMC13_002531 [Lambiella insularis]|nr:hypothetical protein [Lambiella insularis]
MSVVITCSSDLGSNFTSTIHTDTYPFIDSSKSDVSDSHVFISGASKGIGRATALSFARAGAAAIGVGARSDLKSLTEEIAKAASQLGKPVPRILSVQLDVTDPESVEAAAREVKEKFNGRLDILVNNAGVLEAPVPIVDSKPDTWWNSYIVNVRSVYLVTRVFLPMMIARGGDKATNQVVNIASIGALWVMPGLSSYQTGKLALLRFAEFINAEYGDKGILSYSIHPGNVTTSIADHFSTDFQFTDTLELPADTIVYLTQERREWLAGRYISAAWHMPELMDKQKEIVDGDLLKIKLAL